MRASCVVVSCLKFDFDFFGVVSCVHRLDSTQTFESSQKRDIFSYLLCTRDLVVTSELTHIHSKYTVSYLNAYLHVSLIRHAARARSL